MRDTLPKERCRNHDLNAEKVRLIETLELVKRDVIERTKSGMVWGLNGHPTLSPATMYAVSAALSVSEYGSRDDARERILHETLERISALRGYTGEDMGRVSGYRVAAEMAEDGINRAGRTAHELPQDVINLVIAAREFWDDNNDLSEESKALDKALEPFAGKVLYGNEP